MDVHIGLSDGRDKDLRDVADKRTRMSSPNTHVWRDRGRSHYRRQEESWTERERMDNWGKERNRKVDLILGSKRLRRDSIREENLKLFVFRGLKGG